MAKQPPSGLGKQLVFYTSLRLLPSLEPLEETGRDPRLAE